MTIQRLAVLVLALILWIGAGMAIRSPGPTDDDGAPLWVAGGVAAVNAPSDPKVTAGADPETDSAAAGRVVKEVEDALEAMPDSPPDGMIEVQSVLTRLLNKERDHYMQVVKPVSPEAAADVRTASFRTLYASTRAPAIAELGRELDAAGFDAAAAALASANASSQRDLVGSGELSTVEEFDALN